MTRTSTRHLGLDELELAASGAIWTAREIEQQPRMLEQTHVLLGGLHARIASFIAPVVEDANARVILTGAGSSSYIGQCLAPLLDRQHAARVDAVPTTDLVSAPHLYLDAGRPLLLVSFGRSGNSPESLAAVEIAESLVADVRHLVVTCNAEGALNALDVRSLLAIVLPEETHDSGFAMTSSFSCMLYATLAAFSAAGSLDARIGPVSAATAGVISDACAPLHALAGNAYDRVVYLGSGLFQGLAREAALKLGELTNGTVATCFDSPMGFRHGPKTFITDRTMVMVFVSNDALTRQYDQDLLDELRRDACAARVIEVTAHVRDGTDDDNIHVANMQSANDVDLLWPYLAVAQIYAFHASLAHGLTPDNPNPQGTVNRVVQGVRIHSTTP